MNTKDIRLNRLYGDLAYLCPLVSKLEDYAKEASFWRDVLMEKLGEGNHHILELGVGGGNNLSYLTPYFKATAVDLSEEMLKDCKKLNPDVDVHVGDMRSVRLNKKFDAVIIHDAISYLLTEDDLISTFETVAEHLNSGGIFVTTPKYLKETFTNNSTHCHEPRSDGKTELTFIEYIHDPDPKDTMVETIMVCFIKRDGQTTVELDKHETGLFPKATCLRLIEQAGFKVEEKEYPVHDDNRQSWLFVGTKI